MATPKAVSILLLRHLGSAGVGLDLKAAVRRKLDSGVHRLVHHIAWCKI